MIKLVAFDWNGTLFADTYTVFRAAQDAYKFLGLKNFTFYKFKQLSAVPIVDFYEKAGADRDFVLKNSQKVASLFHTNYEKLAIKCRTRHNTKLVLSWLEKHKILCVLFSNHTTTGVEKQLVRLKLKPYFDEVLTNNKEDSALKGDLPKKAKLNNFIDSKRIEPSQILIVGDTIEEIEIAKEIGASSVAITHGNVSTTRLKKAKPDYLISDLGNLINIIRKINAT